MKIVIMGTGRLYSNYKEHIRKDLDIIRFIDNDSSKWGKKLDGIIISPPESLLSLEYDWIFLLSTYHHDMRQQLIRLGIPTEKIFSYENHIEKLCKEEPVQFFGSIAQSNDSTHILIFSPSLISTGAQNVLLTAMKILRRKGFQLAVISRENGVLKDQLAVWNIPVIIMRDIYSKKEILKELILWSDIVFINTLLLYYVVLEVSKEKKPIFWWIHEYGILQYIDDSIWHSLMESPNIDTYVVSPLVRRKIEQRYGQTFHLFELQYGLPQLTSTSISEEAIPDFPQKSNPQKMIFAMIGAIGYIKGQDLFLCAAARLPKEMLTDTEFWIVGPGKLSKKDSELAEQLPYVKIIGEIPNHDMWKIYQQIDIVVCASRVDALPVVIAEGCKYKKLVIVSDASGSADYIGHMKTGLIFANENVNELADRMHWVWEYPDRAKLIADAGYSIYQNHFTIEIFEQNLVNAIQNVQNKIVFSERK